MARQVKVGAAQMGPINESTSREKVVFSRRHPPYDGQITQPVTTS